jgi:hypothetical protein
MKMKNMLWMVGALLMFSMVGFAQEAEEITEEEIMKYATVEDSVNHVKALKTNEFNEALQSSELLNGGRLYVDIKNANGDEAKLAELEVTDEIMAEYDRLMKMYDAIATDLVALKRELVQNKDLLGVPIYNKITRGMRANSELKAQVEEAIATLGKKWEETEEEDTDEDGMN